jgi:DnaJ-class molecular chaperone
MSDFAVPNATPGRCAKCNGSGVYRWGGAVVNGVFKGKEGSCHSCGGTGRQTRTDIARNMAYNRHKLADMAASMADARDGWES